MFNAMGPLTLSSEYLCSALFGYAGLVVKCMEPQLSVK